MAKHTDTRKPHQLLQIQERSDPPTGYACPLCGAPIIMAAHTEARAWPDGSVEQFALIEFNDDAPARCGRTIEVRRDCPWRGMVKDAAVQKVPKV